MIDSVASAIKKGQTSFKGDVLRLMSGTVLSQAITVVTMPIISRFYAPDAFGILALFSAIASVIGIVACWRFELAIVLPRDDKEAVSLLWISLLATACTTFCVTLIVLFFSEPLLIKLKALSLLPYRWFIPVFVGMQGTYSALTYWNTRTKSFSRQSVASVLNSVMTRFFNVVAGMNNYIGGGAMISAMIFGQLIATLSTVGSLVRHDSYFIRRWFDYSSIIINLKKHKKFPIFSVPEAFLNALSLQMPAILLTFYFDSSVVGFFAFGHRLLAMPASIVGGAISQVFFQRGALAKNVGNLSEIAENVFNKLVIIGIFPFILLMVVAPELFGFAFGEKWIEAGKYLQILAPWVAVGFVTSPVSSLISILERQEFGMYFNALLFVSRIIPLVVGGVRKDITLALVLLSISGVFSYMFFNLYILGCAGVKKSKILSILFTHIIFCCLFISPILAVKFYFCSFGLTMLTSFSMLVLYCVRFKNFLIRN